MRKAPQERQTPIMLDHDHWEKVRIKGQESGLGLSFKRDNRFKGGFIDGPEGVRQLRDICDAWLEAHGEESE